MQSLRRTLFTLCAVLALTLPATRTPHAGGAKSGPVLLAQAVVSKTDLTLGDSVVVTLLLYSNAEFQDVAYAGKELKLKNARVRRVEFDPLRTVRRRAYQNRVYNSVAGAQYVIAPKDLGTLTMPKMKFRATLRTYEGSADPFAEFFGYRRRHHDTEVETESAEVKVNIAPEPQKTTEELLRENSGVL